ncbi:MAG: hypothetical protein V1798_03800 [Pseudomonadota bacterium]
MTRFSTILAPLFFLLAAGIASPSAASTAHAEIDFPQDPVFAAAKRHLLNQAAGPSDTASKAIHLEDATAGLLRFTYQDGSLTDTDATIEIVDLDGSRSRLKVTIPSDFGGRSELLLQKLKEAVRRAAETSGQALAYDAKRVYRAALRYVLKTFISSKQKKEDVVFVTSEDVGLIRFIYRKGTFKDPNASIEVIPAGSNASRLHAFVPSEPTGRQALLEGDVLAAVKSDLGGEGAAQAESDR